MQHFAVFAVLAAVEQLFACSVAETAKLGILPNLHMVALTL